MHIKVACKLVDVIQPWDVNFTNLESENVPVMGVRRTVFWTGQKTKSTLFTPKFLFKLAVLYVQFYKCHIPRRGICLVVPIGAYALAASARHLRVRDVPFIFNNKILPKSSNALKLTHKCYKCYTLQPTTYTKKEV